MTEKEMFITMMQRVVGINNVLTMNDSDCDIVGVFLSEGHIEGWFDKEGKLIDISKD